MTPLFHAHSGLRYLVLLAGVAALAYYALALATNRPFGKPGRIFGSVFAGLFDLQILIGLVMVAMGRWYPAMAGHLAMMVLAAGVTHALLVLNRKRPQPGHLLPLVAVAVALVLTVGGIYAIGRGPLMMTGMRSIEPAPDTGLSLSPAKAGPATEADRLNAQARELWVLRCESCHGPTGKGDGPRAVEFEKPLQDLADPAWQAKVTDAEIEKIIELGGAGVGKDDRMPPNPDLEGDPVLKVMREQVRALKRN